LARTGVDLALEFNLSQTSGYHRGEVPKSMANKVTDVENVTEAIGGVALAERTAPMRARHLPSLRTMSADLVRSHLQRLPEAAPLVPEAPLPEADLAPGFVMVTQAVLGLGPIADLSVDSDGHLFATNHTDNSVSQLDARTLADAADNVGADEPFGVAAAGGRAYVGTVSGSNDAITVIEAGAIVATYPVAGVVRDLTVDADGSHVYVARSGRDGADVAVIDTDTGLVTTIDLGTGPSAGAQAICLSADGARLYVATAHHQGGELVAIDARKRRVIGALVFAAPIRGVAAGHDGGAIAVATDDPELGAVIDFVEVGSHQVTGTVELGGAVSQLVLSAEGDRVYVVNGDRITVLCPVTHEVVDTIMVGAEPSCIVESHDGTRIFVADYLGRVTTFSVASTTASLLAGMLTPAALELPALRELAAAGA
jgi:DNA-binding beta-propeller fold protein YncE